MLERLQSLFLGEGAGQIKFRWLVFYGMTVAGFVFVLLESYFLAGDPLALRLFGGAPFVPWHFVWAAFGAAGALLAFKPIREGSGSPSSQGVGVLVS